MLGLETSRVCTMGWGGGEWRAGSGLPRGGGEGLWWDSKEASGTHRSHGWPCV